MVCMPRGREQPQNAAAVVRVGAGRTIASDAPADVIHTALTDVLDAARFRLAAAAMAATIGGYGRGRACVDELEALIR
jgi:UDP:flavonoid glycosyltransferase YjiC (YdhE family)